MSVRQPLVGKPLALAEGDKNRPGGLVEPLHPGLQGADGAELELGETEDGLFLGRAQLGWFCSWGFF